MSQAAVTSDPMPAHRVETAVAPLVDIRALEVDFPGAAGPRRVLKGVSLAVQPGEIIGLVGESGAGKTTLARSILGVPPAPGRIVGGEVVFEGRNILALPEPELRRLRGRRLSVVVPNPRAELNPTMTIGRQIAEPLVYHQGKRLSDALTDVVGLLAQVQIGQGQRRLNDYPHQFSGGMRQRIMIAMALAANPSLLLADEPTTALDVVVQAGILRLLTELRHEKGMGLLLVSHDLAVVGRVSDRVAVMYAGQIVEEGPTSEVLFRPHMPYTIGLIASVQRDRAASRLSSIPGSPPTPGSKIEGCRFAPRCPLAVDACRRHPIPPVSIGPGHWARCIRTEAARALTASDFAAARTPAGERANV